MSIKIKRIFARKIVLSYFYLRFKFKDIKNKLENNIDNVNDEIVENKILFLNEKGENLTEEEILFLKEFYEKLSSKQVNIDINSYFDFSNFEKDINDLIDNFFFKEKKIGLDIEYIFNVGSKFDIYLDTLENVVNNYLETFKFNELDLIDKSIFLLGYIESKETDTPKKIIQNEMVELAKRYGDEGSPKLINAIFYKIFGDDKKISEY